MSEQLRIALIADDAAWTEALADYLRGKGFQVQTAADGLEGLVLLEQGQFSAAVIAFEMSGLNGLELLRELRQRRRFAPVVLVSGNDDGDLSRRAHEMGAFAYLAKTASAGLLLQALEQAVKQEHHPAVTHRWGALVPIPRDEPFSQET